MLLICFRYLGKEADLCFTKKRKNTKTMQNPQPIMTSDYFPVYFQKMYQVSLIYK